MSAVDHKLGYLKVVESLGSDQRTRSHEPGRLEQRRDEKRQCLWLISLPQRQTFPNTWPGGKPPDTLCLQRLKIPPFLPILRQIIILQQIQIAPDGFRGFRLHNSNSKPVTFGRNTSPPLPLPEPRTEFARSILLKAHFSWHSPLFGTSSHPNSVRLLPDELPSSIRTAGWSVTHTARLCGASVKTTAMQCDACRMRWKYLDS